eukprot:2941055-Lingulodinium_polyedra.AAC.1
MAPDLLQSCRVQRFTVAIAVASKACAHRCGRRTSGSAPCWATIQLYRFVGSMCAARTKI